MRIMKSKKKFLIMNGYTEVASFIIFEDAQAYLKGKNVAETKAKYKKGARAGGVKSYPGYPHSVVLNLDSDFEYVEGIYQPNKHEVD